MGWIRIRGGKQNNLQNISLDLKTEQMVVFTGVSGSGKSSLAFDTLFIEGQRRYLESLGLGLTLPRANVDLIEGLSPTLAVSQGSRALTRRTTVGTLTGLADLFAILFAYYGTQYSRTGRKLTRKTQPEIVASILADYPEGARLRILAPISGDPQRLGFVRVLADGKEIDLSEEALPKTKKLEAIVDRIIVKIDIRTRLSDSVRLALEMGRGIMRVECDGKINHYSEVYVSPKTGETFPPLTPADFNFNSPHGACPKCKGIGCKTCKESGLKPQSLQCKFEGYTFDELMRLRVDEIKADWKIEEIVPRIQSRLEMLKTLGLGYLSLDRRGDTLSIGEAQRVQLTAQLGNKLSGVTYILDEPSRGLHPRDVKGLINALHALREHGNTLIVVEHNPLLIAQADHVIEIGPGAGKHGGTITFDGTYKQLLKHDSPTGRWLSGKEKMPKAPPRRKPTGKLKLKNASRHNIRKLSLDVPLGNLVLFCGVSGAGKSTLIELLAEKVEHIIADQRTAGASPKSTPATYIGLMTPLRKLFSETPLARARGYTPSHFTLSKKGGRCEACEGLGEIRTHLELWQPCDLCQGKRYNEETLQVHWNGYSMADVLSLSAEEALALFDPIPELKRRLTLMKELGLDYLELGQRAPTLSGGELQRLKLISALAKRKQEPTVYILDEPTVGLHLQDVEKLTRILHKLVNEGHSVWVVEHQLALLDQADWIIELEDGQVIFQGQKKELVGADTPTGKAFS